MTFGVTRANKSTGAKVARIFSIVASLEFVCVAIWGLLIQDLIVIGTAIYFVCLVGGVVQLMWFVIVKIAKIKGVKPKHPVHDDEYMRFVEDNSRTVAIFAAFLMFAQLAILEITTGAVIRVIDAFVVSSWTYLTVFLVHNLIKFPPYRVDQGEKDEEQVERSADQA